MKRRITQVSENFETSINEKRNKIEDLFNIFLIEKEAENCASYTITYYKNGVEKFLSKYGVKYVDELTKEKVLEIIIKEKSEKPNNSIRTLNTKIMALRTFIYYCQEKGLLPEYQIKLLRMQEKPKETYSDDELKLLIRKPKTRKWAEWRNWAAVNYLIATGNRASSVINIKIKDVDFVNKRVSLSHTKNKKTQIIPLSNCILDVLDVYLKSFEWDEESYLFPSNEGEQWQLRSFQHSIANYNKSRGVQKTSIHLFRHTFAKKYLLAGGSIGQLQRLLGHTTPEMSLHYASVFGIKEIAINYEKLNPLNMIQ